MAERVALYPGSFDPITMGHVDIVRRGLAVFDRLVVAIAVNPRKTPTFTEAERVALIQASFPGEASQRAVAEQSELAEGSPPAAERRDNPSDSLPVSAAGGRIEVVTFTGLLVDYCRQRGITTVLRGLRAVSDFEFEFQLASMNRRLTGAVDYIFMMTSEEHYYISSSLVREVAYNGGDVTGMVPEPVNEALRRRFAHGPGKIPEPGATPARG